jgi:hypothetical protein
VSLYPRTEAGFPKEGRVSWLLRQLQNVPDSLKVEANVTRSSSSLAATLRDVRENPGLLYPDNGREIRKFILSTSSNMGAKRDNGRGSFVDSVITAGENFYRQVLQNLGRGRHRHRGSRVRRRKQRCHPLPRR